MSSQKQAEISAHPSEVSKFYHGKSVFITGAAGFLGGVMLEILLRCCPGICRIYILLRSKKGVEPEDRKQQIFKKEIFIKLLENNPDVQNKVVVVSGDVTQENLGMSQADLLTLIQEVSIIFHCAAAISFSRPLGFMITQNVISVNNVIEFGRKLKKLEVLVYTSTAYSNSNLRSAIEEKVYKLPVTVEEAMEATRNGNEEELKRLMSKCYPPFPNNYTFSKCLAENLIAEKAKDLPVCIVRPSIIICCFKGPLPGYVEHESGISNLCIGVGKGFVRVVRLDLEKRPDLIPVDTVANTHIIAAYKQVSESYSSPFVYNCTSGELVPVTWGTFVTALKDMVAKYPLSWAYQRPSVTFCKSPIKYAALSMFEHYTPALIVDILLRITGRQPRLLKLYRFYDKSMKDLQTFMLNQWDFKCENFKTLMEKLDVADSELFPVDYRDFDLDSVVESLHNGAPIYLRNNKRKKEESKRITELRYFFTSIIKWAVLCGIFSVFYIAIF